MANDLAALFGNPKHLDLGAEVARATARGQRPVIFDPRDPGPRLLTPLDEHDICGEPTPTGGPCLLADGHSREMCTEQVSPR